MFGDGNQIILNGPYKPFATLEAAVRDGVKINIDHLDEIEDLEAIATILDFEPQMDADIYLRPSASICFCSQEYRRR